MNDYTRFPKRPFPKAAEASDPIFSAPIFGHSRMPVVVSTVSLETFERELQRQAENQLAGDEGAEEDAAAPPSASTELRERPDRA
jgi:hypothetical protein